jgi:hypothetical protein
MFNIFKKDCERSGHKFELRYNEVPSGVNIERSKGASVSDIRSLLFYNEYLYDICVRCGKIIRG